MRLLTAKGVEDEERRRRRGGLGKKSSFANERIFPTEALELGRTAAFELSAIVLVVVLVLVVGLLALLVKSGFGVTNTVKETSAFCSEPRFDP